MKRKNMQRPRFDVGMVVQGALGAMSFGAYSAYQNNTIMELNNKVQEGERAKLREENAKLAADLETLKKELHSKWVISKWLF
jgi:hypothetical protein